MTMTRRGFVKTGAAAIGGLVSALSPDLASAAGPASPALKSDCHKKDFVNWSQTVKFTPNRYCEPTTEQRVIDIVKEASASQPKTHVRAVGARHSFSQLVATPDTLMSLEKLKTPAPTFNGYRATVPAGMSLKDVIQTLKQHNPSLGLKNLGSIKAQSIAGAIATGTHGTGVTLGSLSTQVVGVCLIDGQGNARTYTDASPGDYLSAARVSLGALGVVTEVTLDCADCYTLHFTAYLCSFDDMLANLDDLVQNNERILFWWLLFAPGSKLRHKVIVMTKNRSGTAQGVLHDAEDLGHPDVLGQGLKWLEPNDAKLKPLLTPLVASWSGSGFRRFLHFTGDYDKVLATSIPAWPLIFHRECEYAIPADSGKPWTTTVAALKAFKTVIDEGDLSFLPVEIRFVAKDDVLLSPAYNRDVCYIGASSFTSHATLPADNAPEIFTRFEPIMREHGGVPHWGKIFSLTRDDVKALYPARYDRFIAVRNELDPDRVFSNSMMDELFPYPLKAAPPTG